MLHGLLLILKILGILLLITAAALLFLLCAALFMPVVWRIDLKKEDDFCVCGSAGWLFRVVTAHYRLGQAEGWKQDLQIRLLGIPILKPFEEKKPKKEKPKRRKKPKSRREEPERQKSPDRPGETGGMQEPLQEERHSAPAAHSSPREKKKQRQQGKIVSLFRRIDAALRGVCNGIKRIWKGITGAGDRVSGILKKKDDFLQFWQMEECQNARGALWKEALYLWRKSRPKKIKGELVFGFDDPSLTGKCLGLASMLCAWHPQGFRLVPDFEQKVFRGELLIRGKIRIYIFVCILWRVFFNKDVRHMYRHWKQG